jgi:plastocyanin
MGPKHHPHTARAAGAMTRGRRIGLSLLVVVLAGLTLAGCSNNRTASINRRPQSTASESASTVNGVQQITVDVDDTYRFSPDVITVHPGQVKITLVHLGTGAPHDLSVVGFPADFVPLVNPHGSTSATFTAPAPGRYQFVCTIHIAQGQTGSLVVLAN